MVVKSELRFFKKRLNKALKQKYNAIDSMKEAKRNREDNYYKVEQCQAVKVASDEATIKAERHYDEVKKMNDSVMKLLESDERKAFQDRKDKIHNESLARDRGDIVLEEMLREEALHHHALLLVCEGGRKRLSEDTQSALDQLNNSIAKAKQAEEDLEQAKQDSEKADTVHESSCNEYVQSVHTVNTAEEVYHAANNKFYAENRRRENEMRAAAKDTDKPLRCERIKRKWQNITKSNYTRLSDFVRP